MMNKPIKVMRLFSRLNIGGPALHVVNLSFGLNKYDYETMLVVGQIGKGEGDMSSYAAERKVEPVQIPEFQAAIHPLKDFIALIKIIKLIHNFKPTIVHTHTFKAGLLGRVAAVLCRVPYRVHTYHGHLLEGYGSKLRTKIIIYTEKFLNFFTQQVVAVSPRVGLDLVQHKIVPDNKMNIVELGFDVDQLIKDCQVPAELRKKLQIANDDLLVGIAGRLVPVKNVEGFLNAVAPLFKKFPSFKVVIIGDGPERQRLEKIAQELKGRFYFTGWVLPLHPQLKDLDLLVCSSENEGTSVSVIEAVLCKVPVISTNVGGMSDLLKNGEYGDLVPLDTDALSKKIEERLLDLSSTRSEKTIQYRQRVEVSSQEFYKRFHLNRLLNDMDKLYKDLFK